MKYFLLCFVLISTSLFADNGLSQARELAEKGIIVNQSSIIAPQSAVTISADIRESALYRISDPIIRQEVLGMALKLKWITLPDAYVCRDFFRDTGEWWVCRAAELSADADIVTRANLLFRPHDTLTLGEALGILLKGQNISLSTTATSTIPGDLPDWQKRLILTIQEKEITMNVRDDSGRSIAVYDARIGSSISGFSMSHRMTRGQFFQLTVALLDYQDTSNPLSHCTVYNDGCNDCTVIGGGSACTKRSCFWQWIPSCSECEIGYTLESNRCVKKQTACIQEGKYAGGWFVAYPENLNDFMCCSGLVKKPGKDADKIPDVGNVCIREGDGYCDTRYESEYNSADCRTTSGFDSSICQSYYDGCNSCSKTDNGQTVCTLRACLTNWPAYCTNYVSYIPETQTADSTFLSKVESEIRNYTKDLSCTINAQCQWSMIGYRACGWPSMALAYSTKNIDETLLSSKNTYYTNAQKKFNEYYGIMSDCMYMMPPPQPRCINGLCQ
jgi:hypothetical protein